MKKGTTEIQNESVREEGGREEKNLSIQLGKGGTEKGNLKGKRRETITISWPLCLIGGKQKRKRDPRKEKGTSEWVEKNRQNAVWPKRGT